MHRTPEDYVRETRENMKGGAGNALFEHIWKKNSNDEMHSSCRMFSRITLNPGCSIGRHTHKGEEEMFYILSGHAKAWDNDRFVILGPGDSSICRPGEEHSMECYGTEPVIYIACIPVYQADPKDRDRSESGLIRDHKRS